MKRVVSAVAAALLCTGILPLAAESLGIPPTYMQRAVTADVPNGDAITLRAWVPGLDEGFVPQGLTVAEGQIVMAAYRGVEGSGCRLYRLDPEDARLTGTFDMPARCGHAGGLAYAGDGRLFVSDTWVLFELDLAKAFEPGADETAVVRQVSLNFPMRGSFLAYSGGALWIGEHKKPGTGQMWRVPLEAVEKPAQPRGLTEADAAAVLTIAAASQGAAFDKPGNLWLSQSSSQFGRLQKLDPSDGRVLAEYRAVAGIEDLGFDAEGMLWSTSEAGSRRWPNWPTNYPFVMRFDPARLQ